MNETLLRSILHLHRHRRPFHDRDDEWTMTSPETIATTTSARKSPLGIAHRKQRFGGEEGINDAEAAAAADAAAPMVVVVGRLMDDYKDACCGVEVTTRCSAGPEVVKQGFSMNKKSLDPRAGFCAERETENERHETD